jgi:hypothetical protein
MHVATRASVLLLSVLLLVQLGLSRPSWGWILEGHRLIAMDAIAAPVSGASARKGVRVRVAASAPPLDFARRSVLPGKKSQRLANDPFSVGPARGTPETRV